MEEWDPCVIVSSHGVYGCFSLLPRDVVALILAHITIPHDIVSARSSCRLFRELLSKQHQQFEMQLEQRRQFEQTVRTNRAKLRRLRSCLRCLWCMTTCHCHDNIGFIPGETQWCLCWCCGVYLCFFCGIYAHDVKDRVWCLEQCIDSTPRVVMK